MITRVHPARMCGGRVRPFRRHLKPRYLSRRSLAGSFMMIDEGGNIVVYPPETPDYGGIVFDAFGVAIFWDFR